MTTLPTGAVDVDRILTDLATAREKFNQAIERGDSPFMLRFYTQQVEQAENVLTAANDAGLL